MEFNLNRILSPPDTADVVIIGAGIVGAAVAFHAMEAGMNPILVERRTAPASLTTPKATGAFRLQFDNREEIELISESVNFYVGFHDAFGIDIEVQQMSSRSCAPCRRGQGRGPRLQGAPCAHARRRSGRRRAEADEGLSEEAGEQREAADEGDREAVRLDRPRHRSRSRPGAEDAARAHAEDRAQPLHPPGREDRGGAERRRDVLSHRLQRHQRSALRPSRRLRKGRAQR